MSSLTDLDLTFAIPPDFCDFDPFAVPAIDLPSLTSLTVRDMTSRWIYLLPTLHCHLTKLDVAAGEDDDHADYARYENTYHYLLQVCRDHKDPLSVVTLKRTPHGFLMKGTRLREGGPAHTSDHGHDDLVRIELVHGMATGASMVTEELVTRAINVVPPRETHTLLVALEDIVGLDLPLVAWYLHGLPGIRVDTITMSGYEEEWWHALEDEHSVGSDHWAQGDGDPRISNPNTEGDGSQDETE